MSSEEKVEPSKEKSGSGAAPKRPTPPRSALAAALAPSSPANPGLKPGSSGAHPAASTDTKPPTTVSGRPAADDTIPPLSYPKVTVTPASFQQRARESLFPPQLKSPVCSLSPKEEATTVPASTPSSTVSSSVPASTPSSTVSSTVPASTTTSTVSSTVPASTSSTVSSTVPAPPTATTVTTVPTPVTVTSSSATTITAPLLPVGVVSVSNAQPPKSTPQMSMPSPYADGPPALTQQKPPGPQTQGSQGPPPATSHAQVQQPQHFQTTMSGPIPPGSPYFVAHTTATGIYPSHPTHMMMAQAQQQHQQQQFQQHHMQQQMRQLIMQQYPQQMQMGYRMEPKRVANIAPRGQGQQQQQPTQASTSQQQTPAANRQVGPNASPQNQPQQHQQPQFKVIGVGTVPQGVQGPIILTLPEGANGSPVEIYSRLQPLSKKVYRSAGPAGKLVLAGANGGAPGGGQNGSSVSQPGVQQQQHMQQGGQQMVMNQGTPTSVHSGNHPQGLQIAGAHQRIQGAPIMVQGPHGAVNLMQHNVQDDDIVFLEQPSAVSLMQVPGGVPGQMVRTMAMGPPQWPMRKGNMMKQRRVDGEMSVGEYFSALKHGRGEGGMQRMSGERFGLEDGQEGTPPPLLHHGEEEREASVEVELDVDAMFMSEAYQFRSVAKNARDGVIRHDLGDGVIIEESDSPFPCDQFSRLVHAIPERRLRSYFGDKTVDAHIKARELFEGSDTESEDVSDEDAQGDVERGTTTTTNSKGNKENREKEVAATTRNPPQNNAAATPTGGRQANGKSSGSGSANRPANAKRGSGSQEDDGDNNQTLQQEPAGPSGKRDKNATPQKKTPVKAKPAVVETPEKSKSPAKKPLSGTKRGEPASKDEDERLATPTSAGGPPKKKRTEVDRLISNDFGPAGDAMKTSQLLAVEQAASASAAAASANFLELRKALEEESPRTKLRQFSRQSSVATKAPTPVEDQKSTSRSSSDRSSMGSNEEDTGDMPSRKSPRNLRRSPRSTQAPEGEEKRRSPRDRAKQREEQTTKERTQRLRSNTRSSVASSSTSRSRGGKSKRASLDTPPETVDTPPADEGVHMEVLEENTFQDTNWTAAYLEQRLSAIEKTQIVSDGCVACMGPMPRRTNVTCLEEVACSLKCMDAIGWLMDERGELTTTLRPSTDPSVVAAANLRMKAMQRYQIKREAGVLSPAGYGAEEDPDDEDDDDPKAEEENPSPAKSLRSPFSGVRSDAASAAANNGTPPSERAETLSGGSSVVALAETPADMNKTRVKLEPVSPDLVADRLQPTATPTTSRSGAPAASPVTVPVQGREPSVVYLPGGSNPDNTVRSPTHSGAVPAHVPGPSAGGSTPLGSPSALPAGNAHPLATPPPVPVVPQQQQVAAAAAAAAADSQPFLFGPAYNIPVIRWTNADVLDWLSQLLVNKDIRAKAMTALQDDMNGQGLLWMGVDDYRTAYQLPFYVAKIIHAAIGKVKEYQTQFNIVG